MIHVIEGPRESGLSGSARADSPVTMAIAEVWEEISSLQKDILSETTFADLVERAKGTENMYHI